MLVFENLKKNPMVSMRNAISLLTQLSVAQNGINYPETLNEAVEKTSKHISSIMNSNSSIDKKYLDLVKESDETEYFVELDDKYVNDHGYNPCYSLVNIIKLLYVYNNDLLVNGKNPLFGTINQESNTDITNIHDLNDIAGSMIDILTNIVNREGKIKVETFDAIFLESTQNIKNNAIRSLLPELKDFIRKELDMKITKGRITTVTDKKIQAVIQLADKYKDKAPDEKQLLKDISGFDLKKPDKVHVAQVFISHRNE